MPSSGCPQPCETSTTIRQHQHPVVLPELTCQNSGQAGQIPMAWAIPISTQVTFFGWTPALSLTWQRGRRAAKAQPDFPTSVINQKSLITKQRRTTTKKMDVVVSKDLPARVLSRGWLCCFWFKRRVSPWGSGKGPTQPPCSCRALPGDLLHQTQTLQCFGSRRSSSCSFPSIHHARMRGSSRPASCLMEKGCPKCAVQVWISW